RVLFRSSCRGGPARPSSGTGCPRRTAARGSCDPRTAAGSAGNRAAAVRVLPVRALPARAGAAVRRRGPSQAGALGRSRNRRAHRVGAREPGRSPRVASPDRRTWALAPPRRGTARPCRASPAAGIRRPRPRIRALPRPCARRPCVPRLPPPSVAPVRAPPLRPALVRPGRGVVAPATDAAVATIEYRRSLLSGAILSPVEGRPRRTPPDAVAGPVSTRDPTEHDRAGPSDEPGEVAGTEAR